MNTVEYVVTLFFIVIAIYVVYKVITYTQSSVDGDENSPGYDINLPGSLTVAQEKKIVEIIHKRKLVVDEWIVMCKRIFEPKRKDKYGVTIPIMTIQDLSNFEAAELIRVYDPSIREV